MLHDVKLGHLLNRIDPCVVKVFNGCCSSRQTSKHI